MQLKTVAWVLCALWLTSCGGPKTPAEERARRTEAATGEILIGAAWPWETRQNLLYWQGMQMALDEANAAGGLNGRRIRILREDDRETVDQGRAVAQKLAANPDVVAVIGHMQSYVTVPAAAIYDLAGVLLLAPTATDPALTEQSYKLVFRTTFTDKQVGRQMAQVALARGYRRLAIYYMRDRYGRSLANAFEETFAQGGGDIVARQSYDPNEGTSGGQIEQMVDDWRQRDLRAMFIAGEAPQAALVVETARRRGLDVPVLGGDALGTPELFARGAAAVEGVLLAMPFHPDDPRPEVRQFNAEFSKRFGTRPDTAAALAYDTLRLLVDAMRRAKSPAPTSVATALRATSAWSGVTGRFAFDASGDLVSHPLLTVVAKNGRFAFLSGADGE
jgi:branched-chain amino acid transport system substrate-binding protein